MCGRYTHNLPWAEIVSLYRLTLPDEPPETYREPFKQRRCLVPATGWYEWQKASAKGEAALSIGLE